MCVCACVCVVVFGCGFEILLVGVCWFVGNDWFALAGLVVECVIGWLCVCV